MVRPKIYEWKSRFQGGTETANILNKQSKPKKVVLCFWDRTRGH